MRVESVDEVEIIRRMTEGIYDKDEYEKALAWTKEKCIEGFDKNPENLQKTREQKDSDWEFVVKMMLIIKDLMNGNQNLPAGCEEEMVGHNAIAAGFQPVNQLSHPCSACPVLFHQRLPPVVFFLFKYII